MSGLELTAQLIWFAGAFSLVISALLVRRIPMADMVRMGLAWAAIIALVTLGVWGFQLFAG